jgi:hypothetical protein
MQQGCRNQLCAGSGFSFAGSEGAAELTNAAVRLAWRA